LSNIIKVIQFSFAVIDVHAYCVSLTRIIFDLIIERTTLFYKN